MKRKLLTVLSDCEGALSTAIRIRIIYLQSYREQLRRDGFITASDLVMQDIANLTMLQDNLTESQAS